jgi:hypothetical protein
VIIAGPEVRLNVHNWVPPHSAETLPKEVLEKMYAGSSLNPKYPLIRPDDLKELYVPNFGHEFLSLVGFVV